MQTVARCASHLYTYTICNVKKLFMVKKGEHKRNRRNYEKQNRKLETKIRTFIAAKLEITQDE